MDIHIRPLQGEEMLDALYKLNQYSLHPSPPFENKEEWTSVVSQRKGVTCHAAFVGTTPVSIAVSTAMTQNMRGKMYPAAGIWGVATHPSVRRKGYCRQTIAALLRTERESGKAFSNLYPFRESFYQNLGYVTFPLMKIAKLAPQNLFPLVKLDLEGDIELQLIGDAYAIYREYLADMRQLKHGMAFFDMGDQASANRNTWWAAIARIHGTIEGIMLYRLSGDEVSKFNFTAFRFYYKSSRARYLMLNWIARHIDQADRVEIWLSADEYPETWLADMQVKIDTPVRAAMSRVLDVDKIAGMKVGAGNISVKVIDPICPWNEAVWQFKSQDEILEVTKTAHHDCELTIQGLSALISGVHNPQDFSLRGWGNPNPTVQAAMKEMFPPACPYLHENF